MDTVERGAIDRSKDLEAARPGEKSADGASQHSAESRDDCALITVSRP
jgi:hypothetical protein